MSTITPSLFGYYETQVMSREIRVLQAIPFVGSIFSIAFVVLATMQPPSDSPQFPLMVRVQFVIRGIIGVVPGVGLALIPIDFVATLVDWVRHAIHNPQLTHAHVPALHR